MQTTLDDAAARSSRPVFVAETAYPFRLDSDDSLVNQIDTTRELVSGRCHVGNGWENQALFGFDDKALPAMSVVSHR